MNFASLETPAPDRERVRRNLQRNLRILLWVTGILDEELSAVGSRFVPMTSTETFDSSRDVSGLDLRDNLLAAAAERRQADRSEARLLALAIHQVHLHPVDDETPVASWA